MDNSKSKRWCKKSRLSERQVEVLERNFTRNRKLEGEQKQELARLLGVSPKQVAVWYQNKRARCKTEAIELHHHALQLQLQRLLAHNHQLQSQVHTLTRKLNHYYFLSFPQSHPPSSSSDHHQLLLPTQPPNLISSTTSTSISENDPQLLPIMQDLYACLFQ